MRRIKVSRRKSNDSAAVNVPSGTLDPRHRERNVKAFEETPSLYAQSEVLRAIHS